MPQKRKPSKNSRNKQTEETSGTVPKGIIEKQKTKYKENTELREQLRDRIRQMQKDRAKGSYVCEENANHEY